MLKMNNLAEQLDQLKAEMDGMDVENILTDPADLNAYKKSKEQLSVSKKIEE